MSMGELSSMMHCVLFGLEKVLMNRFNVGSKVFIPYILDELEELLSNLKIIDKEKSIEENIEKIKEFLSNDDVFKGIQINRINDNDIVFQLEECSFATSGVHDSLEMGDSMCACSLIASSILSGALDDKKYLEVQESEYTDKGSKTVFKIKDRE